MTINVQFVDSLGYIPEKFHPVPAKTVLPGWYKRIDGYHDLSKYQQGARKGSIRAKGEGATIKKCMPVFDAISAGYILFTPQDLQVYWDDENGRYYEWSDTEFIRFHNSNQLEGHPTQDGTLLPYPKFANPWSVITPKGYSCMFVQPMHRESVFELMPGVVDTDMYHGAVQLPFVFKEQKWEGVIPAGTPMCQVIPFKRESFTHSVHTAEELGYNPDVKANSTLMMKFINAYRDLYWDKKEYN